MTSSDSVVLPMGRSMSLPLWKVAPARTRATRWGAFTARHRDCAASMSLNAIATPAAREPRPLVTLLRCRTVAKVDSIVIWSWSRGVFDVHDGAVRPRGPRAGHGYLPLSSTWVCGRFDVVQRVVTPSSRRESWTVIGRDGVPIEPIERYLAYLTDVERSPNTVRAYAHDLKDWFVFLAFRGLDWREVRLEDVGEFVAWLRLPPAGRDGRVVVLPSVQGHCGDATVNRKLSAVSAFYQHQARNGIELGDLLRTWQPAGRRG